MTEVVAEVRGADEARRTAERWIDENWDPEISIRDWLGRLADSGWAKPTWAVGSFGLGLTNEEAAQRLGISERTVRRILKRLESRLERAFSDVG